MSKKEIPPPDEILAHLYLGTRANAKDIATLDSLGITHILNVADELDTQPPAQRTDLQYLKITVSEMDILSGKNQWDNFDAVFQFIDDAKNRKSKCLVHCLHGRSRSAFIVIAWTSEQCYTFVKKKRSVVSPHSKKTLLSFQKHLGKQISSHYEHILGIEN